MANRGDGAMNMIHLLERVYEPLGFGLRGGGGGQGDSMIYYYYDDKSMMDDMLENKSMREMMPMVRSRVNQAKGQGVNVRMEPVPPRPKIMPDLRLLSTLCPKDTTFCYFNPRHRQAFTILKKAFMMQGNPNEVYRMAVACRDSSMINPNLFVYSFCSCLVSRPDTKGIQIPSHVEISPDSYCSSDVVRQAIKMAHMPDMSGRSGPSTAKPTPILIDGNVTGRGSDPEQRMWYFREDILVNSHHFHWHIVFPACSPKDPKEPGYRDRRGELFYYMHHSMIARYDTERLTNGLPRTKKIDFNNYSLDEGYFGKLASENSGSNWGTRQANTKVHDVRRPGDGLHVRVEDLTRWRDRILEAIDLGYYVYKDPKTKKEGRVTLDDIKGIDVLGDIIENSTSLSPHLQYYGIIGFHNVGHILIAFSNDPRAKFKENPGPMGDVSTAMRDPAFYRWHKYIDHMFDLYKQTLTAYPLDGDGSKFQFPLRWKGISVVPGSLYVQASDSQERNRLGTFWDYKNVDFSRGLDFRRNVNEGMKPTQVIGRFTHLNHGRFDYNLKVENKTGKTVRGTVRIFLAPRNDEHGERFALSEQRLLFFEMDKQSWEFTPGVNNVKISSTDSSVTLRDEEGSSFKRIEQVHREARDRKDVAGQSQCSCGWPQHLLIPKGSGGGMEYDLFVIVTDGAVDQVPNVDRKRECNSALSFCGVLNEKYPDARPMGYPFDRVPYNVKVMTGMDNIINPCPEEELPVIDLDQYTMGIPNAGTTVVRIFHDNSMKKGDGEMGEQVMMAGGKCIRMKDYYGKDRKQSNVFGSSGWGSAGPSNVSAGGDWGGNGRDNNAGGGYGGRGNNRRPEGTIPPKWANQEYGQWPGPEGERRGRQDDDDYEREEDWERLSEEY